MFPFEATTQQLTVSVRPVYLDEQSDVFASRFVFAYFVRLENHGHEEVQLLRRHWVIRHGDGRVANVEGEGVVGLWGWGTWVSESRPEGLSAAAVVGFTVWLGLKLSWLHPAVSG